MPKTKHKKHYLKNNTPNFSHWEIILTKKFNKLQLSLTI